MSQRCRGANGGAWCSHPAASNPLNASASTEASGPDAGRSAVISFSLRWAGTSPWYRILRSTLDVLLGEEVRPLLDRRAKQDRRSPDVGWG